MRIQSILLIGLLVLSGCGVGSFADLQSQAKDTEAALEKEFGSRPKVNWRTFNGTLISVDVIYDAKTVSSLSVRELSERTQHIVAAVFKDKPKHVVVSVTAP